MFRNIPQGRHSIVMATTNASRSRTECVSSKPTGDVSARQKVHSMSASLPNLYFGDFELCVKAVRQHAAVSTVSSRSRARVRVQSPRSLRMSYPEKNSATEMRQTNISFSISVIINEFSRIRRHIQRSAASEPIPDSRTDHGVWSSDGYGSRYRTGVSPKNQPAKFRTEESPRARILTVTS